MRLLLDTHTYFWWATDSPRLSRRAAGVISDTDNQVLVSAVAAWELATKGRLGKWEGAAEVADNMDDALRSKGLEGLPVTIPHARLAGFLPGRHRDPFDRLLAAQAQLKRLTLITADPVFREFEVPVLW